MTTEASRMDSTVIDREMLLARRSERHAKIEEKHSFNLESLPNKIGSLGEDAVKVFAHQIGGPDM